MDILVNGIGYVVGLFGVDTSFVGALPTALMKSLSGSGAHGLMIDTMKQYGADSFVGRMRDVYKRQQIFLHYGAQPVYFVDEKYIIGLQAGKHSRQIPDVYKRQLQRRAFRIV